jgi:hypothetical protein
MVSDMVRHQTIHLSNPDINYVRLENCKYCKVARMRNYETHRRNGTIPPRINVINYFTRYDTIYYNPMFNQEYEDVEVDTTLKRLNSSTSLQISRDIDFCSICQDTIDKDVIVRKMICGHKFHQECVDKWLENNTNCPICRQNL